MGNEETVDGARRSTSARPGGSRGRSAISTSIWRGSAAGTARRRAATSGGRSGSRSRCWRPAGSRPWSRSSRATSRVKLVTAVLGLIVVLAKGVERIWNFEETWQGYRKASERMKREYRLYINGAGAYREVADEDQAYLRFVEAIEEIIAEEQQLYWQSRVGGGRPDGGDGRGRRGRAGPRVVPPPSGRADEPAAGRALITGSGARPPAGRRVGRSRRRRGRRFCRCRPRGRGPGGCR